MNAVYQFPRHALTTELLGNGNVECDGQASFGGDEPAGHILRRDLVVGRCRYHLLAGYVEHRLGVAFYGRDLLLREAGHQSRDLLHVLAVLGTEGLEVGLDTLCYHARRVAYKFDLLDVHFVHYERLDSFDALGRGVIEHRYEDLGKRLAYLDIDLAAQCQHHRRYPLRERHHLLQLGVDQRLVRLGE